MAANADEVAAANDAAVPLLVRVLAGNSVTSATILACLTTADVNAARRLHPAVAGAVAGVPWADMDTPVVDPVRWRAGLPAAVGARMSAGRNWPTSEPVAVVTALSGLTRLDLRDCVFVTDDLLARLPTSLRALTVSNCRNLTPGASFAHLTALTSLDCSWTEVVRKRSDGLPHSLQELSVISEMPAGVSLAHLSQLRVLRTSRSTLDDATLASLPPCLLELQAVACKYLTPAMNFGHLTELQTLNIAHCAITDRSLATLPPSLVCLDITGCTRLSRAAVLPRLPALQLLDARGTDIGDALVASLPDSLVELRMARCPNVTAGATLDHVLALRVLHSIDTPLAPAALASCRARGCAVSAADMLRGEGRRAMVSFALLSDGRLASGDTGGEVRLWDTTREGDAVVAVLHSSGNVFALAGLPDGRRLAVGVDEFMAGSVEVWDVVRGVPPVRRAIIGCGSDVYALAALADGCLAAGCADGAVRVVDVGAATVSGVLEGHAKRVAVLAVLPGGALLASGSWDKTVRVWDMGARTCVATLAGHAGEVWSLAVLADGRLASASRDCTVRLWDVGTRTCVGVLTGHTGNAAALAALPDGRLASSDILGGTIRLWDTRPAAAARSSRAAGAVPMVIVARVLVGAEGLAPLPGGRLACADINSSGSVHLLDLPPPPDV